MSSMKPDDTGFTQPHPSIPIPLEKIDSMMIDGQWFAIERGSVEIVFDEIFHVPWLRWQRAHEAQATYRVHHCSPLSAVTNFRSIMEAI